MSVDSYDMWCFEGYYVPSSPIFYTFFNPKSESVICKWSYSYSYIGGNDDGCFIGSKAVIKKVDPKSALTRQFDFTSMDEEDEKIQRQFCDHFSFP